MQPKVRLYVSTIIYKENVNLNKYKCANMNKVTCVSFRQCIIFLNILDKTK